MKKYFAITLLAGGMLLTSCSDSLLEYDSTGQLTADRAIKTSSDLGYLMNTAYSELTSTDEIDFNSVFTDEAAIGFANGGQGLTDNAVWILNPSTGSPNAIWVKHYVTLAYVNRVIKYYTNVTPVDDADQQVINRLRAEALTVRAYCHNQLLEYFSTDPKDMSALGVELAVDVYETDATLSRVSNGDVYAQIDADLAAAEALYQSIPGYTPNPILANRNFTKAVRARSYAQRGDYTNALTAAQDVIDNSGLSLATFANYTTVFHTDANPANTEVIFKLKQQNGGVRVGGVWASVNATVNGSPFFEMGRNLFNALNTTTQPGAVNLTVTSFTAPNTLVIPGNTLHINDMISFAQSRPSYAVTNNGTSTVPSNALLAGKVYFVKTVNGDNITLTDTANGTTNINISGVNPAQEPFTPVAAMANSGDIRYATLVAPTSIIDANYLTSTDYINTDKIAFRKYPGTSANGQLVNDIKIARLTEMYLIKAEAQTSAGDLAGAALTIQQVRNARFNTPQALPVYGSATDAWKDILLERQKDFAAEGYRFIDLKRIGTLAGLSELDRDPQDCALARGACSLPLNDHRWTLPIPQAETNPNPGIQQNPGY